MVALFRFFTSGGGGGSLPPALRAEFEPEGILGVAEKVGVRQRFSGSVPGCHSGVSVTRHKGLLVFTRRRLYALIPTLGASTHGSPGSCPPGGRPRSTTSCSPPYRRASCGSA